MYKEQVHKHEYNYIINKSELNRSTPQEVNAKYIKYLKFVNTVLKEKHNSNGLKSVLQTLNTSIQ